MDHAVPQGMDQCMDRGVWIVCGFRALIHTLYFDSYPYIIIIYYYWCCYHYFYYCECKNDTNIRVRDVPDIFFWRTLEGESTQLPVPALATLATLATLGSFQKWKYPNSWMVYDGKYMNILLNILFKWINNKQHDDLGVPRFRKLPCLFVGIKQKTLTQPHWARPFRMGIWIKILKPLAKWDSHPNSWLGLDILRPKIRFRDHVLHFVLQKKGLSGPKSHRNTIHRVCIYIYIHVCNR